MSPTGGRALRRISVTALLAASLGGCDSRESDSSNGPVAKPEENATVAFPVAYALDRKLAPRLATEDALEVIDRDGRVVAKSQWKPYVGVVLANFLEEEEGIRLLDGSPALDRIALAVSEEQEFSVVFVTDDQRRRYARRLGRVNPDREALRRYYETFTEESDPEIGRGMQDWLRVFRVALSQTDRDTFVVVPALD